VPQGLSAMAGFSFYTDAAMDIARQAGAMLREALHETRQVESKTFSNDLVTEMDRKTEAFIVSQLRSRFPEHDVRCEEGANDEHRDAVYRWIVDPIDGTNNYLHRFPWFAVSMGLAEVGARTRAVSGVIYHVMMDEMYSATLHEGAFLNGARIRVSDASTLRDSLIGTGFAYWIHETQELPLANLQRFLKVCHGIRRAGAASLDMAMVACGRYDAYYEDGIQLWDVAAGVLLVREAGGTVTDYDGQDVEIPQPHIIASNGSIHAAMVDELRGQYRAV
jgi:myo-inositol-1(or 4)-monophosphatase